MDLSFAGLSFAGSEENFSDSKSVDLIEMGSVVVGLWCCSYFVE